VFVRVSDFRERISLLPLKRVALNGFWLNAVWEFVQCPLFYDMWDGGFWYGAYWMWRAIFVDVLIVLGVLAVASWIADLSNLQASKWRRWVVLFFTGFLVSLPLEWIPRSRGLWQYAAWMPTMEVFGQDIGLLPVVQVTILPALSFYLAIRKKSKTATNQDS